MKILEVDEKWSIQYDDKDNDRPVVLLRNGEVVSSEFNNLEVAMFYALLDAKQ